MSSQWSRARESTSDWIGVTTPTSHGFLPTQSSETRSVATALALVSGSQRRYTCREIGSYAQAQILLRQGHRYLDGDGDGEACESLRSERSDRIPVLYLSERR
mgnify:CR=1 FL=1